MSRRNRFAVGACAGFLVGLTRPTVITLPVLFLWEAIRRIRRGEESWFGNLICAAAPLAGLALYLGVVGYLVDDPLGYLKIQAGRGSSWRLPFLPLVEDLSVFLVNLRYGKIGPVDQLVRFFFTFSILGLIAWGWRKFDPAFLAYLIVSMIFIHSQEPHAGTARYEMVLFPIFLMLPRTMISRPPVAWIVAGLMVATQILLFIRHATWAWVS